MSTVIDERVVSMQFDNKHFEKNVSVSMNTLQKLKQSLEFKGATKGLEEVQKSVNDFDFSKMEYTSYKTGLQVRDIWYKMWSRIEYDIGNKIKNIAGNTIKAFTIDPVKTGLSEYETQLNSIQTILANTQSKGTTLEQVTAALDELNTYADKTIYNFTEMTRNIGTFTAAGVDLDTSVTAIQGIANLAAISGSTSQQASTAMYQLSQALSSGTVRLMDWNSVVNAGMGGQVFQDALKETAKEHGIAVEQMIKDNGSFRESLQEGWLTSEVLTDTLAKFTDETTELGKTAIDAATKVKTFTQLMDTMKEAAQSGWAQTWKLIIGDFEEAKGLWTNVSNIFGEMINKSAEVRNKLLSGALNSGWETLLGSGIADEAGYLNHIRKTAEKYDKTLDHLFNNDGKLDADSIQKGLKDGTLSADMLSESLNSLTNVYKDCSDEELKHLGYTREQIDSLVVLNEKIQNGTMSMEEFTKKITRLSGRQLLFNMEFDDEGVLLLNERTGALVNIVAAFGKVLKTIKSAWTDIFPKTTSEQLYRILERFREFTEKLIMTDETAEKLKRTFKGLFSIVSVVWHILKTVITTVTKLLGCFKGLGGGILTVTASLGDFITSISDAIKKTTKLEDISNGIVNVVQKIVDAIKNFFTILKQKIDTSGFQGFLNFLKKVWDFVKSIVAAISNAIKSIFSALGTSLDGTGIDTIFDVLNVGLITTLIVQVKKFVDNFKNTFKGIKDIAENFNNILGSVGDTLKAFQSKIKAQAIKTIAVSIAILAGSIFVLSLINKEKLEESLAAITLLLGGLMVALQFVASIGGVLVKSSVIISLATAIFILSFALTRLGKMDQDAVITGLFTMTAALGIFSIILSWMSKFKGKSKMALTGAKQMMQMSFTLIPLGLALKLLSTIPWDEGLLAIGYIAGTLAAFTGTLHWLSKISSTKKMATKGTTQFVIISLSLIALGLALKLLSTIPWDEGLITIGFIVGTLAAFTGTLHWLSKISSTKKMATKGTTQLLKLAMVLYLVGIAFKKIAKLEWPDIGKGAVVMIACLAALVTALQLVVMIDKASSKINGVSKGNTTKIVVGKCAQLTLIATALSMLALSLAVIAQISWPCIVNGIIAMTLMLTALVGALAVMSKINNNNLAKNASALILLAAVINMLTLTLFILGKIEWSTIKQGIKAMTGVLLLLVGSLAIMSKISAGSGSLIKSAGSLLIMGAAINLLAGSLLFLGHLNIITIGKGLLTIAGSLTVLGIAAYLLAPVAPVIAIVASSLLKLGVACLAASAGIALLGLGLSLVGDSIGPAIDSICKAIIDNAGLIGKAVALLLVSVLDAIVEVVDSLVVSLAKIIVNALRALSTYTPEIASVLMDLIIGVLDKLIDYIPAIIDLGVKLISKIFEGIIGSLEKIDTDVWLKGIIATGLMAGLLYVLSTLAALVPGAMLGVLGMAAVVAEIMILLAAFGGISKIPGIASIIADGGNLLQTIGIAIGQFVGGILGGIAESVASTLPQIAVYLSDFMTNLKPFMNGISSVSPEALTGAKSLASAILILMAASVLDRLTKWIKGGLDMGDFGDQLAEFGEGIKNFAKETKGINAESVSGAAEAGKTLAEMAKKIPTSGGLWNLIKGEKDLGAFGNQLQSFGSGISKFATKVKNVNGTTADAAAKAGLTLAEMAKKIPTSGGIWNILSDENKSLKSYATAMSWLGESIYRFGYNTQGVSAQNIMSAAQAGLILANMASKIPTSGGLWQMMHGEKDLGDFGNNLVSYGKAIKSFVIEVSSIGDISTTVAKIEKLTASIQGFSVDGISSMQTTFDESKKLFNSSLTNMITSAVDVVKNKTSDFISAGKNLIIKFLEAIRSYKSDIKTAFSTSINDMVNSIKGKYNEMYNSGNYLAEGLANGINDNSYKAVNAAESMARAVNNALKNVLVIKSPSHISYGYGEYYIKGLTNSLDDNITKIYKSSANIGQTAVKGLKLSLSKIKDIVEDGIDTQPTIRPVLDLSNITTGAKSINGLFDTKPSVSVLSKVSSINSTMSKNQNDPNYEVISAIRDLKNTISASQGDVITINGITYDNGSEVQEAIGTLIRAVKIEGRR